MLIFKERFIYVLTCLIQSVPCCGCVEMANLYKLWRRSRFGKKQSGATGEKLTEHINMRDEKEGGTNKTFLEEQAEQWFKTRRWKFLTLFASNSF